MTPAELHAKARRAAEWLKSEGWDVRHRNERWTAYSPGYGTEDYSLPYDDFRGSDRLLIAFCEDHGWQDDHVLEPQEMVEPCADEEEALDCCARGMAQFMDEVDPDPIQLEDGCRYGNSLIEADGVEWISHQAQAWVNNCFLEVDRLACGKWAYKMTPTKNRVLQSSQSCGGTAPTIEEAKKRAVEAARRMNNENV